MVEIKTETDSRNSKMRKTMPIVVIGQNYSTSLGIIKALGEAGYRVEVGRRVMRKPRFITPEMKSKYVDKTAILYTCSDEVMIENIIQNFAVSDSKKLLIPSDDFCVALMDRNYDCLSQYFILPNSRNKQRAVTGIMNKDYQNEIARKCAIKVTDSVIIKVRKNEPIVIPQDTPFPCFIKPVTSVGYPKSYSQKSENKECLTDILSQLSQEQEYCTFIAERFVEIEREYTIPGIAVNNQVIIPAILEKFDIGSGAHKGVTIAGRVHKSSEAGDIVDKLKSFVGELGFQGIFDIELFWCKGEYYFNEINLRNGAAGYSLTKSGINLPGMYADYLMKAISPPLVHDFESGRTFVNEKAALENYCDGYSNFRTLCKTIGKADIRFILSINDIKACIVFCLLSIALIIRKYSGNK